MAEYLRQAAITGAIAQELDIVLTNSDGNADRRAFLLGALAPTASERVIDPGIEVVTERLSVDGTLDPDCASAIQRWFGKARNVVMDELLFEIRQADDPTRVSAGRLVGTLLRYEETARDRHEVFARGSLKWDEKAGVLINLQHDRQQPLLRAFPVPWMATEVKIDAPVPNTTRGRDAITNIREGIYTGLSIEFKSRSEGRRGNLREIRTAFLGAAALVDTGAYAGAKVEVRAKSDIQRRIARLWL